MPSFINLAGKQFGRLTVIRRAETIRKRTRWLCRCTCGNEKAISAYNLKIKDVKKRTSSCGCQGYENRTRSAVKHGQSRTPEMILFWGVKARAKKCRIEFSILPSDIAIPKKCPYLGISLFKKGGVLTANSPSLDRIDPSKGYVSGNVRVISYRANAMKSDSSFADFERMYFSWKAMQ